MMMKRFSLALAVVAALLLTGSLSAQLAPSGAVTNARALTINVKGGTPQELYINNVLQQVVSYPYKVLLPIGAYTIVAKAPGYKPLQQSVRLTKDMAITLTLVPDASTPPAASGVSLTLQSNAAGANFYFNNQLMGSNNSIITLPKGRYNVRVTAPGFADYNETLNLDRARNYSVFLQPAAPTTLTLTVLANVPSAQVQVNGNTVGTAGSPLALPAGVYQVRVSAPGYSDYQESLTLSANRVLNVTLKPALFALGVSANVKGAQVYINNSLAGTAGQVFNLGQGTYQIRVSASGYNDWVDQINLVSNQTINAQLNPSELNLTVRSNVAGAQVYVNNTLMGVAGSTIKLPVGSYQIKVTAPGYIDGIYPVVLSQNQTIEVPLSPVSWTLQIATNVPGAQIFIGNNQIGTTSVVTSLTGGTYILRVTAPGYNAYTEALQLQANTVRQINLQPMGGNLSIKLDPKVRATIFLNNARQRNNVTLFENLEKGSYVLRIVLDNGLDVERTVIVEPGKTVEVSLFLGLNVSGQ